jgi:hypothetical protein
MNAKKIALGVLGVLALAIALSPEGEGTRVTWTMNGHNSFMGKLFGLFVDVDEMLGADFDRGLENLDEQLARPPS